MTRLLVPGLHMPPHYSYALHARPVVSELITTTNEYPRSLRLHKCHKHYWLPLGDKRKVSEGPFGPTAETQFLRGVLESCEPDLVLCGTDRYIEQLHVLKEQLGARFVVASPDRRTVARFGSKVRTRQYAKKWGVAVPPGQIVKLADIEDLSVDRVRLPTVFKFDYSESSAGVSVIHTRDDLAKRLTMAKMLGVDVVLEDFLGPSQEVSHQFFVDHGDYVPVYSLEKLTHLAPSYSTAVRALSVMEEQRTFAGHRAFLSRFADGLYSAQFKYDQTGCLRLIEVNCRLGNNVRIVSRMFPDLIPAIVSFYVGDPKWRRLVERIRSKLDSVGFSVVEDILARVQSYPLMTRGRGIPRPVQLTSDYVQFLLSRPQIDDYFASVIRHPSVSVGYYRRVLQMWRAGRKERYEKLEMVGR